MKRKTQYIKQSNGKFKRTKIPSPEDSLKPEESLETADILKLRRMGWNLNEIAVILDADPKEVEKKFITAIRGIIRENFQDAQMLELDRLDELYRQYYPFAANGSQRALDSILRLTEKRFKLLGLEAPCKFVGVVKNELDLSNLKDDELEILVKLVEKASNEVHKNKEC
jgi:DNA-binding transcriptional MerR regulator